MPHKMKWLPGAPLVPVEHAVVDDARAESIAVHAIGATDSIAARASPAEVHAAISRSARRRRRREDRGGSREETSSAKTSMLPTLITVKLDLWPLPKPGCSIVVCLRFSAKASFN